MAGIPAPTGHAAATRRAHAFMQGLRSGDTFAHVVTLLCAASILLVTVALVHQLYINSTSPIHKFGFRFLTGRTWDPVSGEFGALPFIYGTLVTSALALLVAVPLGVGAASIWRAIPEAHFRVPTPFSGADVRGGDVGGWFDTGHHGRAIYHFALTRDPYGCPGGAT